MEVVTNLHYLRHQETFINSRQEEKNPKIWVSRNPASPCSLSAVSTNAGIQMCSLRAASTYLTGMYHERQKSIISINNEKFDTKIAHALKVK